MISVFVEGCDFTPYLLVDGGCTINREALDPDTLEPVTTTAQFAFSDTDSYVSDVLRLPRLDDADCSRADNIWQIRDGTKAPYRDSKRFEITVLDSDGTLLFGGYIEKASFSGELIDAGSPDSGRIVRFSAIDYLKQYLADMDTVRMSWDRNWDNFSPAMMALTEIRYYDAPGYNQGPTFRGMLPVKVFFRSPGEVTGSSGWWYGLGAGVSSLPFFYEKLIKITPGAPASFPKLVLKGDLENVWTDIGHWCMVFIHMYNNKDMWTIGNILRDLGKMLYATYSMPNKDEIHMIPMDSVSTGFLGTQAEILNYSVVSRASSLASKVKYVRDIILPGDDPDTSEWNTFGRDRNGDFSDVPCDATNGLVSGINTAWYYYDKVLETTGPNTGKWVEKMKHIRGDSQAPFGVVYDAIPPIASSHMGLRGYAELFLRLRWDGYFERTGGIRADVDKWVILHSTLIPPTRMIVKAPGVKYWVGQTTVLDYWYGWRIVSVDTDCTDYSSELTLERMAI
jgi:hypothetical protein